MKKILLGLLVLAAPVMARETICEKYARIETRNVNSLAAVEFLGAANSSGTYLANGRGFWIRNNDATAANYIYISTFAPAAATLVVDTAKAIPVPGGNTGDPWVFLPWAANIRKFIWRASGTGSVTASTCE